MQAFHSAAGESLLIRAGDSILIVTEITAVEYGHTEYEHNEYEHTEYEHIGFQSQTNQPGGGYIVMVFAKTPLQVPGLQLGRPSLWLQMGNVCSPSSPTSAAPRTHKPKQVTV